MHCKDCGNSLRRLSRRGFLQKRIYSLFGYYPWECSNCGKVQLLKSRGNRRRSRKAENAPLEVRRHAAGLPRRSAAD